MKGFKKMSRITLAVMLVVMMFVLAGCTAVQVSATLTLNGDGTGSRTITASIAKNDHQDGYGSAYYYLKKHGSALEKYLTDAYKKAVPGSEKWLEVSVDDTGSEWEIVNLTFEFKSFVDYKEKLAALAYDSAAAAAYVAPALADNGDGTATYTENAGALTAIFKSLQTTLMADASVFDIDSTKDGKALNDGSADLQSLVDFGVELMKPEFGNAMTIDFGKEAVSVAAADGVFTVTGEYAEIPAVVDAEDTTDETEDGAENTTEEAVETSVPKTGERIAIIVVLALCLVGCAAGFIISKKRDVKNQ